MDSVQEEELVNTVVQRLRSFSTRQMLRMSAWQYFQIPMDLSDEDALRVFRRALHRAEGFV